MEVDIGIPIILTFMGLFRDPTTFIGFCLPETPKLAAIWRLAGEGDPEDAHGVVPLIWVTSQPLCRYVHHAPAAKGDPVLHREALGLHTSTGSGRLRQKWASIAYGEIEHIW